MKQPVLTLILTFVAENALGAFEDCSFDSASFLDDPLTFKVKAKATVVDVDKVVQFFSNGFGDINNVIFYQFVNPDVVSINVLTSSSFEGVINHDGVTATFLVADWEFDGTNNCVKYSATFDIDGKEFYYDKVIVLSMKKTKIFVEIYVFNGGETSGDDQETKRFLKTIKNEFKTEVSRAVCAISQTSILGILLNCSGT